MDPRRTPRPDGLLRRRQGQHLHLRPQGRPLPPRQVARPLPGGQARRAGRAGGPGRREPRPLHLRALPGRVDLLLRPRRPRRPQAEAATKAPSRCRWCPPSTAT
ncbi:hypothetical protein HD596_009597 [Nonomuraea jabiensis]|uniref:Uncharacterized protein n=1 Tax=Nonomuraea jabiensis TaxID=882448 RepID=A0A7W9GFW7_9ACTN|nr:hypothetical protein [Nonomuraea jabiensis]